MQGLRKNIYQFLLLVFLNFLVGAVIGFQRSSFYEFADTKFGVKEGAIFVSFVLSFGLSKALANLFTGHILSAKSKKWLLVFGWLIALPGVILLLFADEWWQVILANVFIGLNQGFCWSSNVLLKIDLVGNKNRGLAMGLNEFSGYLAVGIMSILSGYIVANFGFTNLFYVLMTVVLIGLLLSFLFVKDTQHLLQLETETTSKKWLSGLFTQISIKHPQAAPITINGFVNNLIDAVYWLILPVMLNHLEYNLKSIGLIMSVYPIVWAVTQLITGALGDKFCKKQLITIGMLLQVIGLILTATMMLNLILAGAVLIGIGTAFVYPNFLSELASAVHPQQRNKALSYFRFWRDLGYVGGAVLIGFLLPFVSLQWLLIIVALMAFISTVYAELKMCCLLKYFWKSKTC